MEGRSFQILETKWKNFVITGCPRISRHQFLFWNFSPSFEMALGLKIFMKQSHVFSNWLHSSNLEWDERTKIGLPARKAESGQKLLSCVCVLLNQNWPARKKGCSRPEIVKIKNYPFFFLAAPAKKLCRVVLIFLLLLLLFLLTQNWPVCKKEFFSCSKAV